MDSGDPCAHASGQSSTWSITQAAARYRAWLAALNQQALLPVEHLLPTIAAHCTAELPELMAYGATVSVVDEAALRRELELLQPWGYGIQLRPGIITPHEYPQVALRQMTYRSHLITGTMRALLGDSLHSATLLDMACNHGYFALEAAYHGAKSVLGVDLRPGNIAKAEFLKRYFGIANTQFRIQNVYDLDLAQPFDVVYNLGLFYHVTDPYLLMRRTYALCTRFAVIDSIMHREPVSAFLQMLNKDVTRHAEGEFNVELHPTYRAMIDLMYAVGFTRVMEVVAVDNADKLPQKLYDRCERRCLVGFK